MWFCIPHRERFRDAFATLWFCIPPRERFRDALGCLDLTRWLTHEHNPLDNVAIGEIIDF